MDDSLIAALLVVGFHHANGPIVEYCEPPLPQQKSDGNTLKKLELPNEWSFLPFLALPDGAHQKDEDFSYFHLPPVRGWSVASSTLFGISCNRQIATKDLLVTTPDMTRSIVQKAVVVLARQPIFGPLRQKLAVITSAWFSQKDFTQVGILQNLYHNLRTTYHGPIDDSILYMGTSLRELLHTFKSKILILLKLLLLERRILFYGYPVEKLCNFQYSLISLVPGLLRSLNDAGEPDLDTTRQSLRITEARELSNGDKSSLLRFMGLPLRIFEKGAFFQPYLPLQQKDVLVSEKTHSYLVGTTNQIFFHQKSDVHMDVLVNVKDGTLEFVNPSLASLVSPTAADRHWMDKMIKAVADTWDRQDPSHPVQNTYLGSDDHLRTLFEEYLLSLLSSMKHAQDANTIAAFSQPSNGSEAVVKDDDQERNYLVDYGMNWLLEWRKTNNFKLWNKFTDHEIYAIVEPGHPGMGSTSLMDIQGTLSNRLRNLQLHQNLAPIRHTLNKAVSGGAKAVVNGRTKLMRGMDALWNEFERGVLDGDDDAKRSGTDVGNHEQKGTTDSTSQQSSPASSRQSTDLKSLPDSTSGRLFSNLSSLLGRKQREVSQSTEESAGNDGDPTFSDVHLTRAQMSSVDNSDDESAFIDVGSMYPFPQMTRTSSQTSIRKE